MYPERVLASEKKPIRVFLCDGRNDNRGLRGGGDYDEKRDWFYQNVRLMKALTQKGYDVNYSWSMNLHGQKFGGMILPEMMRWLWRDGPVSTDPNDMVERSFRQPAAKGVTAMRRMATVSVRGRSFPANMAIQRTVVYRADVSVPGREGVVVRVEIAPGGAAGRHTHPGDEISYVMEGEGEILVDGQPARKVKAGDGLVVPGAPHTTRGIPGQSR